MRKKSQRLIALLLALIVSVSGLFGLNLTASAATKSVFTGEELIKEACKFLGNTYTFGNKAYSNPYSGSGGSFLGYDSDIDCSGLVYASLNNLGVEVTSGLGNTVSKPKTDVPVDTMNWLYTDYNQNNHIKTGDEVTFAKTVGGKTIKETVEVIYASKDLSKKKIDNGYSGFYPYATKAVKNCPGSIIITEKPGINHMWIYLGEFDSRDDVVKYVKDLTGKDYSKYIVQTEKSSVSTTWRIEATHSTLGGKEYKQVMIDNSSLGKNGSGVYFAIEVPSESSFKGGIKIRKLMANGDFTNNEKAMEDVTFTISTNDSITYTGDTSEYAKLPLTITSEEGGVATSKLNLPVYKTTGDENSGKIKYTVTETKSNGLYVTDVASVSGITLEDGKFKTVSNRDNYSAWLNFAKHGDIKLYKTLEGKKNHTNLKGMKFTLSYDGDKYDFPDTDASYTKEDLTKSVTLDESGEAYFANWPIGNYILTETVPKTMTVEAKNWTIEVNGTTVTGTASKAKAVNNSDGTVSFSYPISVTWDGAHYYGKKILAWNGGAYNALSAADKLDTDGKTSLIGGTISNVKVDNQYKYGTLRVIKTSEDNLVEGVTFRVTGTSLAGEKVNMTAKTDENGVATFDKVLIGTGYTIEEVDTAIRYVIPENQTGDIEWNKVTNKSFYNKLKKFRVTVTKEDAEKKKAQGDATLAGATYGIYNNGKLIDTYVTDENASFTTKYYICGDHWSIREIKPSEGYLLNDTEYHVGAEAKLYKVEFNDTANTVTEPVIKGNISIIKHSDDGSTQIETPEPEAEFQVYLKSSGSYDKADKDERDILDCNEDGYAKTKDLPYGVYTVHQTKGKEGKDKMSDFDVFISENGKTYKYLINNAPFTAYLKITKVDRETGKVVPYAGAGFEIHDSNGKKVSQTFTYPKKTTISTYYTNSEGYLITPEKLDYGKGYSLVEVQAPYGYVLDSTPIKFDVTRDNSELEDALTLIKVKRDNIAQKGIIEVTKSGEVFSSVAAVGGATMDEDGNETVFPTVYSPQYEVQNLKGAVYQIFAAEDIKTPDGTIRYQKGEQVDEITTGDDGIAKTKQLYLGNYTVVEKTAPDTFYNANQQYDVELVYAGQDVAVTSTALSVYNERQKVTTSLSKEMQKDETYKLGMNDEILSVQFGIYAAEEIKAADGSVIPADGLITLANCDKDGNITFDCDLPIGFKWYAKEFATDEHYILSDEQHFFDTEYAGQETAVIDIKLNDGKPIENKLIYGKVTGYKIDRETEKPIKDVVFGIFKGDETEYTEKTAITTATTDENGVFEFINVPYGAWIIHELKPADNYLENTDLHHFDVERNEKVIEMNIVNDRIPEMKTTAAIDGEKTVCATETFTLTDTVEYQHLIPNKEYTVKGTLMNKATGKPLVIDGETYTSEVTFTPEKPNGSIDVLFTFDGKNITTETNIVVFESLYKDGKELAVHADINDKGQTVTVKVPEIKTSAKAGGKSEVEASKKITIVDTVTYKNLTVGKEYVIYGVLMDKKTGKAFKVGKEEVTSQVKFTPKKSNGEVKVTFTFDGSGITAETDLVVFETLFREGVKIAAHADIKDKNQTVKVTVPEKPETPTKTTTTVIKKTPKTGDDTNNTLWWILAGLCAAGAGVTAVTLCRRKKKKEENDDDGE